MNARNARAFGFQAPDRQEPLFTPRDPSDLTVQDVCPHCLTKIAGYAFVTREGHTIQSYWCQEHGDVVPRLSAVHNPEPRP